MSDYKIKSIGKVDFRTYKDVIRVIAIKERGFWTSLFSSPKEAYFILSDESPLYGAVNAAKAMSLFGMFQKVPSRSKE